MSTNKVSLPKNFTPSELIEECQKAWEQSGLNQPHFREGSEDFCILLPPPNVTGVLHMGHAFNQTVMDTLVRYHRMLGKNTLWIPGTDHAGIATQLVVERELEKDNKNKKDLGRNAFIKRIWEWKEQSSNTIKSQIKKLASSVDWSREYFTLDEKMSNAVNIAFVQLYEEGLIYRGKRLVNWDPSLQTAISDLEVSLVEENGFMYYLRYPLKNLNAYITVATTRPETMFGDVAVMVHPDDDRYRSFIGQTVVLPFSNKEISIIADVTVDPEFGTGAVKVTPAHDFNDYEVALRHTLPLIEIFTPDGRLNHKVIKSFQGLSREEARQKCIEECKKYNILVEIKPHQLIVPKNERSGTVIEPMLTDQWFVAVNKPIVRKNGHAKSMAKMAYDAVADGEIEFYPENWVNTYNQWLNNIEDWCISRQLWWGHRIPAWHGENGEVFVAIDENSAYSQAKKLGYLGKLNQDEDVLDTWFSSSLAPFSSLGWPKQTAEIKHFLPSSILVTGFDILFFWVARMIMFTKHFTGKVPFKKVYIHGLVRDALGQKMSKSKGNVIDPIDIIDGINLESLIKKRTSHLLNPKQAKSIAQTTQKQFPNGINAMGADALRFTFASMATMGRNINFDLGRTEGYRNFCNKLWNATRFVLLSSQRMSPVNKKKTKNCQTASDRRNNWWSLISSTQLCSDSLTIPDKWIITKFNHVINEVHHHFKSLRLDLLAQTLYQFIWEEFCDWYLEMAKIQFAHKNETTHFVLLYILDGVLRLLHPLMPFITESLWQQIYHLIINQDHTRLANKENKLLMVQSYPISDITLISTQSEKWQEIFKSIANTCRNLRGQLKLSPAQKVPLYIINIGNKNSLYIEEIFPYLQYFAKLSEVKIFNNEKEFDSETHGVPVAITLSFKLALYLPINPDEEIARTERELSHINLEIKKLDQKLSKGNFMTKAPEHIVKKEKNRMLDLQSKQKKLMEILFHFRQ